MSTPLLSVCLISYNHEKFIRQAIEGILMQKVNFDWELIIAEDCSTDGTRAIILEYKEKYPDFIRLILQETNVGAAKNWTDLLAAPKSKYIAYFEADDYWTDPFKLQKQVDFLEANADYSICWTKYYEKNESDESALLQEPEWVQHLNSKKNITIDLNSIFTPYCTYSLTVLFKRDSLDFALFKSLKYCKDNSMYAICLSKGKGMLMNFYSAVYRIHQGGVYSNASQFKQRYSSYLNLKEIVNVIPFCDNSNIRNIRNYLLAESLILFPNPFSLAYLNLIFDSLKFLGIEKSKRLIIKKLINIKGGK